MEPRLERIFAGKMEKCAAGGAFELSTFLRMAEAKSTPFGELTSASGARGLRRLCPRLDLTRMERPVFSPLRRHQPDFHVIPGACGKQSGPASTFARNSTSWLCFGNVRNERKSCELRECWESGKAELESRSEEVCGCVSRGATSAGLSKAQRVLTSCRKVSVDALPDFALLTGPFRFSR